MKQITVKVTETHIKRGKRVHSTFCPVALALKPHLKGKSFGVMYESVRIGSHPVEEYFPLSKKVQKFIQKFDNNLPVKPFTFCFRYKE